MSSKRKLKKQIFFICNDLAFECLVARDLVPGFDFEKMTDLAYEAANLMTSTVRRIDVDFDRSRSSFDKPQEYNKAKKAYFKEAYTKLIEDFNAQVAALVKKMNAEMPAAVKEANKEA